MRAPSRGQPTTSSATDDEFADAGPNAPEIKSVVVLGTGDWVRKQYAPALRPYQERGECNVVFVYDTRYAVSRDVATDVQEEYNSYTLTNVKELEGWGATCLDLADEKGREHAAGLSPDAVFVVTPDDTHCRMVEEWLPNAPAIFVEKPFDVDHERVRRLRLRLASHHGVWGFDHYLTRANQFAKLSEYLGFPQHVQETIREFRFHMLEPRDRGMKERVASIQTGMILDMGSHTPALVLPFGDPNTITLDSVRAGVYRANPGKGVHTDGAALLTSGRETFAEIRFSFTSTFGNRVAATACVGKSVGDHTEKYVEIVGGKAGDRRVRLDMDSCIVDFVDEAGTRPVTSLFSEPVHLLIREVLAGRHLESLALLDPEAAQDVIARLNEWRLPVANHLEDGKLLNGYPGGAPLLEVIGQSTPL